MQYVMHYDRHYGDALRDALRHASPRINRVAILWNSRAGSSATIPNRNPSVEKSI